MPKKVSKRETAPASDARYLKRPAPPSPECSRNSSLWLRFAPLASRTGRAGSPRNDRAAQPHAGRHHDPSRSLQKIALAGRRPTFYQLHLLFDKHYGEQSELVDTIAERTPTSGRNLHRHGRRRGRNHSHRAPAQGQGRSARNRFPACSTRTRSSSGTAANLPSSPINWKTLAPTIWWSATFFAPMNCKSGLSASTWVDMPLVHGRTTAATQMPANAAA